MLSSQELPPIPFWGDQSCPICVCVLFSARPIRVTTACEKDLTTQAHANIRTDETVLRGGGVSCASRSISRIPSQGLESSPRAKYQSALLASARMLDTPSNPYGQNVTLDRQMVDYAELTRRIQPHPEIWGYPRRTYVETTTEASKSAAMTCRAPALLQWTG